MAPIFFAFFVGQVTMSEERPLELWQGMFTRKKDYAWQNLHQKPPRGSLLRISKPVDDSMWSFTIACRFIFICLLACKNHPESGDTCLRQKTGALLCRVPSRLHVGERQKSTLSCQLLPLDCTSYTILLSGTNNTVCLSSFSFFRFIHRQVFLCIFILKT